MRTGGRQWSARPARIALLQRQLLHCVHHAGGLHPGRGTDGDHHQDENARLRVPAARTASPRNSITITKSSGQSSGSARNRSVRAHQDAVHALQNQPLRQSGAQHDGDGHIVSAHGQQTLCHRPLRGEQVTSELSVPNRGTGIGPLLRCSRLAGPGSTFQKNGPTRTNSKMITKRPPLIMKRLVRFELVPHIQPLAARARSARWMATAGRRSHPGGPGCQKIERRRHRG